MKVEVIEKRANQVRNSRCPVCGKEFSIVIGEGRKEGSVYCWFCSSLLAWSIEDEVKPVEEKVEEVAPALEVKKGGGKKVVKPEKTE